MHAIAHEPDGSNINDGCGSTHPESLAAEVVARGAHLGLALDGDADRLLAVDHTGEVATGDELLSLFATDLAGRGELAGNTVVVTVMTNLGFRLAMAERGITVRETQVGDRYVLEALNADGSPWGASSRATSCSGNWRPPATACSPAILLLDLVKRSGVAVGGVGETAPCSRLPQVLLNVAAARPDRVVAAPAVQAEVAAVENELGARGRVLLRASGTEPLVRVMVEAEDEDEAHAAAQRLCAVVEKALVAVVGSRVGRQRPGDVRRSRPRPTTP